MAQPYDNRSDGVGRTFKLPAPPAVLDPGPAGRFEKYHAENPQVFLHFVRLAREYLRSTGARRISGTFIVNRIRWEINIAAKTDDAFKVNDHYTPFYVRLAEEENPDLQGRFEKRQADAADRWIQRRRIAKAWPASDDYGGLW